MQQKSNETRSPEIATYESYGGCSVQLPILPSHPAHLVELAARPDGLHLKVSSMDGVLLLESLSQWDQVAAWMEAAKWADDQEPAGGAIDRMQRRALLADDDLLGEQ